MDGGKVDRLARALWRTISRRQLAALVAALFSMLSQRVSRGAQLGPVTCREQGAVCTLLAACCDGLTCATSAINTTYGICVPGEGGMVSTGTALIFPFSETAVEEITALMLSVSTAPMADLQAEREANIAEIRARKDAKRSKQRTRLDTRHSTQQTRRDKQNTRKSDEDTVGPNLEFQLLNPGGEGGITDTETLRIRNLEDTSVVLAKIESILDPRDNNFTNRTVPPRGSFSYYSGTSADISDQDEQAWLSLPICSGTDGAGFRVTVGTNANSVNQQHVFLCDGPSLIRVNEPRRAVRTHKRKHNDQRQKKKKR